MKKLFFLLSGIIIASCSQKTVEPVTTTKTASTEEIAQGKKLYADYCIKCHKTYNPSDFSAKKWNHIIPEMAKKAKIDTEKSDLILSYVLNGAK